MPFMRAARLVPLLLVTLTACPPVDDGDVTVDVLLDVPVEVQARFTPSAPGFVTTSEGVVARLCGPTVPFTLHESSSGTLCAGRTVAEVVSFLQVRFVEGVTLMEREEMLCGHGHTTGPLTEEERARVTYESSPRTTPVATATLETCENKQRLALQLTSAE